MATKCEENRSRTRLSLGLLILTTILVLVVIGCQGKPPTPIAAVQTPVISEPKVGTSIPLEPGGEAGIAVEVSKAAGVTLTYDWQADGGKIVRGQGSPAITYRAPDEPGTYNVRVVVKWGDQGMEKATSIKVEKPTPTSTPVSPTATPAPPKVTPVSPTATPLPPTATPGPLGCNNFTSRKMIRSPLPPASGGATASFLAPQHCETGIPAGTGISVGGTAANVSPDRVLWLLNYASGNYYPQCDNVSNGECGANLSRGAWGVMAYLGRKNCKEQLHLVLVTVNGSDNAQLTQEMVKRFSSGSGDFGFTRSKLPSSIEEVASIEVETAGGICN